MLRGPRLVVTAKDDRRRRAGLDFGRAETEVDPEAIGEAGLRALVADPLLKVELVFASGDRVHLTTFPPSDADQALIGELAARPAPDAAPGTAGG